MIYNNSEFRDVRRERNSSFKNFGRGAASGIFKCAVCGQAVAFA